MPDFGETASCPRRRDLSDDGRRELWAALALRHCRGLGARSCGRLLRLFGSAYAALRDPSRWPEAGVDDRTAAALRAGAWREAAREEWDASLRGNPRILLWTDPIYPPLLRALPDPPAFLYCDGDVSLLGSPCFAIVGARETSGSLLGTAGGMARDLAAAGLAVVSGMARGVDTAAHGEAVRQVGRSIAVLGTGIDVAYPRSNRALFERMAEDGLLVSEFPPGTPPISKHFPIRNRIISGLSLGVLVISAARRSGGLITARFALEQNREVYAVPGQADDPLSAGCQDLIRQGAKPVFRGEDILVDLAPRLADYAATVEAILRGAAETQQEDLPWDEPPPDDPPAAAVVAARNAPSGATASRKPASGAPAPGLLPIPGIDGDPPADTESADSPGRGSGGSGRGGRRGSAEKHADASPAGAASPEKDADSAENGASAAKTDALLDALPGDPADARILAALKDGPMNVDALAEAIDMDAAALGGILIRLEMMGRIRRLPGARYEAS